MSSLSVENSTLYQDNTLLPFQKFIYALRAPETKRQYPKRLQVFLNHLNIHGMTIEEQSNLFYNLANEKGRNWLESELMRFFSYQNQRAENKEISIQTINNYLKPVKLFCEMNGIVINWKMISKGIKRGDRCSNDRPPLHSEIAKLLEYPDRRLRPIVLIMISSGMRAGSWEYLKWGDITPVLQNNSILAAKIRLFNTKTNKVYFSFITPEAYKAIKEWAKQLYQMVIENSEIISNSIPVKDGDREFHQELNSKPFNDIGREIPQDPISILKLRFAKGEINREQYEEMKKLLEQN